MARKIDKIQFKRGPKANLPKLSPAELAFTTDEKKAYIGDGNENIRLLDQKDKNEITSALAETERAYGSLETANATSILNMTNYLGNTQNIHPKVLYFPSGLWGFKYWMAYTPYPNGRTDAENPCIAVSNDMLNWTVPNGVTNPLDPVPGDGGYNSDTHLLYREDTKTMEIWWRQVDKDENKLFYRRTSTDGVNWNEKELLKTVRYEGEMLSPAVIFKNGKYRVYFCRREGNSEFVMYSDYDPSNKTWSKDVPLNIDWDTDNLRPWHLDVIETDIGLEMIVCCYDRDTGNNNTADLWHVIQYGNGSFSKPRRIIKRSENPTAIDYAGIYRSSFLKINGVYYVFYSMIDAKNNRWMSISYGKNIYGLNGYKDMGELKNGSRIFSVAASLYPSMTDFDVAKYDTLLLNGTITINSLTGGYLGKKVTLVPIGSATTVLLKNNSRLLLAGGKDYTLKYANDSALIAVCTNTAGTEWRVLNHLETVTDSTATLQNGWTGTLKYNKDHLGRVSVRGQLTVGTFASGTIITELPSSFAPQYSVPISVWRQAAPFTVVDGLVLTSTGKLVSRPPASDSLVTGEVIQLNTIFQI